MFHRWFRRFGILEVLSCDRGTNFMTEDNQLTGKWDRLIIVIDTPVPRQYLICLHDSGRVSLRNRHHLMTAAHDEQQEAKPEINDGSQKKDLGGVSDNRALPPPTPAQLRCARHASRYLTDCILP
ncbi:hypothetical protein E2C01_059674 [Portunus trituberculatus]|uniref:Uncharacterized protein n=1 Tax=Portunus trituberculatus TaxID=210409 RepID=A0A5B7H8F7_PORTR|nr:hypothetical protein [Portunus trituberculatus]